MAFEDEDEDKNQNDDNKDDDNEDSNKNDSINQRACHHSKRLRDAAPKPTKMKYYPPRWKVMLNIAKNKIRQHIALINAFLLRETDLKVTSLIILNTIKEYKEEGNILDPCLVSFLKKLLLVDY
jgi:hypothetical protein